jgi:hypothetical protein
MPSYNLQQSVGTYSIDKSLINNLEEYCTKEIGKTIDMKAEYPRHANFQPFSITIHDSFGEEKLFTIVDYKQQYFRNDTKGITIEFNEKNAKQEKEIKIVLRLGKVEEKCDLTISLTDEKAREKVSAVEEGILSILNHHKNLNWLLYPNQLLTGILGLGCLIAGIQALDDKISNQEKFIYGSIFWSGVFYFAICRYFKSYCTFETNKQRQLDKWFSWLVFGTAGFLLFTTLLASVRKSLFGF